jgi:putative FmdB family regulatory protein
MIFKDYECLTCGDIELRHPINDPPSNCPFCGSEIVSKIGMCGFILKGGGFFNDVRKNDKATAKIKAGKAK